MSRTAKIRAPRAIAAKRRISTETHILDAAEELFSRYGFDGVMLKDVAEDVGVHSSLLKYYFKDKKALFDAVITRQTPLTSERRLEGLASYERGAAGKMTVEGILHAYLHTETDLSEGWRHFGALGAQMTDADDSGAALMNAHFDPVVLRLVDMLKKALPDCSEEDIFWGYHFLAGALMLTLARTGRIDKLSGGLCDSYDVGAIKDRMADFMANGFRGICKKGA